jgi:hypothetical protein
MCACVPPPLSRIARRALKARLKTPAGAFGHAPRTAHVPTPPRASMNRIGRKCNGGPLVLSLHTCETVLTHWYLIGLIITFE